MSYESFVIPLTIVCVVMILIKNTVRFCLSFSMKPLSFIRGMFLHYFYRVEMKRAILVLNRELSVCEILRFALSMELWPMSLIRWLMVIRCFLSTTHTLDLFSARTLPRQHKYAIF